MRMESKYQFGADSRDPNDLYSGEFFSSLVNRLLTSNEPKSDTTDIVDSTDTDEDIVTEDSSYSSDDYEELLSKYNDLSDEYEKLKIGQSFNYNFNNDSFLDFLFSDDNKFPVSFSNDELYPVNKETKNLYETAKPYQGMSYGFGKAGEGNKIDCSGYVCKVLDIPRTTSEGILTGSTNFRRYSDNDVITEGTVIGFDMGQKKYDRGRKHGIDHVGVVIRNPDTGKLEFSESTSGKGVISRPLDSALNIYKKGAKSIYLGEYKLGGKVAKTPKELYKGLNDSRHNEMILDLPPQYNLIRGLDNGSPVYVEDENGNNDILYGKNDIKTLYGKVYEKKIKV